MSMHVITNWIARARGRVSGTARGDTVSLNRQMLALAWPSLVENLLQTMLGVVDLVFVGQLGADAIAGVGIGSQLMFLLMVVFMGLSVGNTALVARAVGAQDKADAQNVAKQSLVLAALFSVITALIGGVWSEPIVRVMGAEPQVTTLAAAFLRVTSLFSLFIAIMFIGGGTLRGSGDTRTPMVITGVINLINILLDYLLIFGNLGMPRLGAIGSAYATSFARGIGAVLILYVLFRRGSVLKLDWRSSWRLRRESVMRILRIGGPAAIENIVFQLGFLGFSIIVIGLGTADLAAQQVAFNISGLSILPAFAFGVAALTMVGQSLGAKNPGRAQASAWAALKTGMVWMSAMGVAFIVWRKELVGFYTQDQEVIRLASVLMVFIALGQPMQAISIILSNALRGAGDTRTTLLITFLGIWPVRLGVGYLVGIAMGLGLFGVWAGWAADFATRATLTFFRYRRGRWKNIQV